MARTTSHSKDTAVMYNSTCAGIVRGYGGGRFLHVVEIEIEIEYCSHPAESVGDYPVIGHASASKSKTAAALGGRYAKVARTKAKALRERETTCVEYKKMMAKREGK